MTAPELRAWARHRGNGRAAARGYAIANALDGLSRAEAAHLAGMERQALRDAVTRYNAEGVAGLFDRPKGRRPEWLTEAEQASLAAVIFTGPKHGLACEKWGMDNTPHAEIFPICSRPRPASIPPTH